MTPLVKYVTTFMWLTIADFVVTFQRLGYAPAAGVALALLVHTRDVVIGGTGLLLGDHLAFDTVGMGRCLTSKSYN